MSFSPSNTEIENRDSHVGLLLENQEVHGFNDMKSLRKLLIENTTNKKQKQFLFSLILFLLLVVVIIAAVVATKTPRVIEVINLQSNKGTKKSTTLNVTTEKAKLKASTSQVSSTNLTTIRPTIINPTEKKKTTEIEVLSTTLANTVSQIQEKTFSPTTVPLPKTTTTSTTNTTSKSSTASSKPITISARPAPWCGTLGGQNCTFPMRYSGQTWMRCVPRGGGAWCATSLTRDRQYYTWGYCDTTNCGEGVYG